MKASLLIVMSVMGLLQGCVTMEGFESKTVKNGIVVDAKTKVNVTYRVPSDKKKHPLVILLQSCGGSNRTFTSYWPSKFLDWGYATMEVKTLEARGMQTCGLRASGIDVYSNRLAWFEADAIRAIEYARSKPEVDASKIVAIGFSMGAIALNERIMRMEAPAAAGYAGTISFYGYCAFEMPALKSVPNLMIYGAKDANVAKLCDAFNNRGKDLQHFRKVVYEDAHHSFDVPESSNLTDAGGNLMRYDASATEKATEEVRMFLQKVFAK